MLFFVVLFFFREAQSTPDSYLEAYKESHGSTTIKTDREYSEPYPYPPSAGSAVPQYGPPKIQYGPPPHNYGPPLVPVYGPPPPAYTNPHGMLGILDKIKWKLDLFTIGKILLKIVLFKKFVSFVAIICLLLFIPTLKNKVDEAVPEGGDDDDEAMRGFDQREQVLNNISDFVIGAINSFSGNYTEGNKKCENVFCKTQKIVKGIDDKLSYRKLIEMYSREIN